MMGWKASVQRWVVNGFIATVICVTWLEVLQPLAYGFKLVRHRTSALSEYLGLWQGRWNLFAPQLPTANRLCHVHVTYEDGSTFRWKEPKWSDMNCFEVFMNSRDFSHMFHVMNSRDPGVWEAFVKRKLAEAPVKDKQAVRVSLEAWSAPVPKPGEVDPMPPGAWLKYTKNRVVRVWRRPEPEE